MFTIVRSSSVMKRPRLSTARASLGRGVDIGFGRLLLVWGWVGIAETAGLSFGWTPWAPVVPRARVFSGPGVAPPGPSLFVLATWAARLRRSGRQARERCRR